VGVVVHAIVLVIPRTRSGNGTAEAWEAIRWDSRGQPVRNVSDAAIKRRR
jgi:hypothetical protein